MCVSTLIGQQLTFKMIVFFTYVSVQTDIDPDSVTQQPTMDPLIVSTIPTKEEIEIIIDGNNAASSNNSTYFYQPF